jgi:glycosyltransferase involved in cell wall biosynthesis
MLITNLTFGGAQRIFFAHSRMLAASFDVAEVVFNAADGHAFHSGNEVLSLDVQGGGGAVTKVANFTRRLRRLGTIRRQRRPALTISHLEGADYVNLLAPGQGKKIICVHGSKLHDANIRGLLGGLRKRLLIPLLYNRADRVVTVSHEIGEELVALGVRRALIRTIHNFFDPVAIRQQAMAPLSAEEAAIFAGPPVLVTSGRLALQKNQGALLSLFAELLRQRAARLLLIGDGELRETLVAQARALGLRVYAGPADGPLAGQYDVYFLGFQENPFRLQHHAQLFVLPSGWEGFPMVLGEAMACGLPIVSADCPTGPREFLAPDTVGRAARPLRQAEMGEFGMLLPIPDERDSATVRSWVETLDKLLGDEGERRRMAARSLARAEDFTREKIGGQWLETIAELIGGAPANAA